MKHTPDNIPDWIEPADPGMPDPEVAYFKGAVETVTYRNQKGELHRVGKPAIIGWNANGTIGYELWYENHEEHREDGPAEISWHDDGKLAAKKWYLCGKQHREDGPSELVWDELGRPMRELWHQNDKLHRENGPAKRWWYDQGMKIMEDYFIEGQRTFADGTPWRIKPPFKTMNPPDMYASKSAVLADNDV